ncbi:unnamed protein product, partial [Closterium sp. NIES-53]
MQPGSCISPPTVTVPPPPYTALPASHAFIHPWHPLPSCPSLHGGVNTAPYSPTRFL